MLNKYDFKYILRRVIVFFIIGLILSLFGSLRVRAYGSSTWIQTAPLGGYCNTIPHYFSCNSTGANNGNTIGAFPNYGRGEIVFSFTSETDSTINVGRGVRGVYIYTNNDEHIFTCDIGNNNVWLDNNKYLGSYTARCVVDLTNTAVHRIVMEQSDGNNTNYTYQHLSDYMTFIRDDGQDTTAVVNAITNVYNQALITNDKIQHNNYQNDYILSKLEEIRSILDTSDDAINDINNAIQSDNIDNNAVTDNTQGWEQQTSYVPTGGSGGSITDLLTLPIKLIQGFVNGLNSSCVAFNLGNLYGTDLILPCINISSFIGMPLWTTIDILFSGFMILHIGKKFVKIFNDFTNLRSNQMDDLYGGGN